METWKEQFEDKSQKRLITQENSLMFEAENTSSAEKNNVLIEKLNKLNIQLHEGNLNYKSMRSNWLGTLNLNGDLEEKNLALEVDITLAL